MAHEIDPAPADFELTDMPGAMLRVRVSRAAPTSTLALTHDRLAQQIVLTKELRLPDAKDNRSQESVEVLDFNAEWLSDTSRATVVDLLQAWINTE